MKLATVNQVLVRMNKAGVSSTNTDVIESALEAATTVIEAILGTKLGYSQVIDYYDYIPSRYNLYRPFRLILSNRFLSGDPSIHNSSSTGLSLSSMASLTTDNKVASTDYVVDRDKGAVQFLGGAVCGFSSIAVNYEFGFEDINSNGEIDPSIPQWLNQAAISGAVFTHHEQSSSHSKKDAKDMSGPLYQFMYRQVCNHIHDVHNDIAPARTEEVV